MAVQQSLEKPIAVKAVAIDLDGTLLDTAPDLVLAANRMLDDFDLPQFEPAIIKSYIGHGADKLVKRLLTGEIDGEPEQSLFSIAKAAFFKHYEDVLHVETKPYAGVMEGLEYLLAAGFNMACVTNKPARFTLPILQSTGMSKYFELVLSGDSLPAKKPDPMPLIYVCEQFGIAPHQLVMVGDSAADIQAAHAANCHAFYVPYGYNSGMTGAELDADVVLDALIDIKNLIVKES